MSSNVYTTRVVDRMRHLAHEGKESAEAYEILLQEGLMSARTTLGSFRSRSVALKIKWGGRNKFETVIFVLDREDHQRIYQIAEERNTTPNKLLRDLIKTVIDDNLFNAILDDDNTDEANT